jgi:HK97 family phage major capsid protein
MLARVAAEIEEKQTFIDGLVETAEKEARDLNPQEMELVTRSRTRLGELNEQMEPLRQAREISHDSRSKIADLAKFMGDRDIEKPRQVEYRSAGQYALDMWRAGLGQEDSKQRLDLYNRAAAHQTTGDNPGIIPTPILGPVVDFIDANRPLVAFLGPRQLPSKTWSRPKVTQHTSVATQSAEKTELVSQKMTIASVTGTAATYGGYVNVSRQDIDWTTPSVMDIVISDLAAQYAVTTEAAAATAFAAAATAGTTLPTGANDTAAVAGALWAAAASIYTAVKGAGRVAVFTTPGMLALWGPLFVSVNPTNAQSPGFSAADFGTGLVGYIAGLPIYVSAGIAANTALVLSSAAAEVYEDRIGSLQVVEPSVLGVQVAYAGYFTPLVIEGTGIVKVTKTP